MFLTKKNQIILITGFNTILLFLFLILVESTYRTAGFLKSCLSERNCKYSYLLPQKKISDTFKWGIHKPHKTLGYDNKEDLNTYFRSKKLTTLSNGLRGSFTNKEASTTILTVGDSFAFGYDVNDEDTWQNCLNQKIKDKNFLNGGVNGYGTGQAILKAKKLYPKIKPDLLLVQTTVGINFSRDILKSSGGSPKPYFAKHSKNKITVIPPTPRNEYLKIFENKTSPMLTDYLIVNFTLLKRLPKESFFYRIWENSYSKFDPMGEVIGENHASKLEIINWTVKESKKLDSNVVWLFQYTKNFNSAHQKERNLLKKILDNEKIRYIDTYNYLHGNLNKNINKKNLWLGHHTPLGNKIVCRAILNSGIY